MFVLLASRITVHLCAPCSRCAPFAFQAAFDEYEAKCYSELVASFEEVGPALKVACEVSQHCSVCSSR